MTLTDNACCIGSAYWQIDALIEQVITAFNLSFDAIRLKAHLLRHFSCVKFGVKEHVPSGQPLTFEQVLMFVITSHDTQTKCTDILSNWAHLYCTSFQISAFQKVCNKITSTFVTVGRFSCVKFGHERACAFGATLNFWASLDVFDHVHTQKKCTDTLGPVVQKRVKS